MLKIPIGCYRKHMNIKKEKPWLVNDVSERARDIARAQSADQNIKIGVWVNDLILEHAKGGVVKPFTSTPHFTIKKESYPIISWCKRIFQ
jgi:hypothetical protein